MIRHKRIAAPSLHRARVLILGIKVRFHRRALFPDHFALECELGEVLQLLVARDIEELRIAFGANFKTMTASLKLISERTHEFALGIKHEYGWVILQVLAAFMNDVDQAVSVHRHVVSGLPGVFIRQLRPVVQHFISVITGADDELLFGLRRREHSGHRQRGGCRGDSGNESAARD
jgi:hypothetical protein